MPRISPAKLSSAAVLLLALPASGAACGSASFKLTGGEITGAETVAAGSFQQPGGRGGGRGGNPYASLPALCRVSATLKPSSDSDIKIEVWLPAEKWNGTLESVGNGAWAGTIGYAAMAAALSEGYAAASTDTGHAGNNVSFITDHPEKVTDFAYRAVHEMTVAAKNIAQSYYGQAPKHSYFNGCSTGGRQALEEAQKYPADYDGIISGDPDLNASRIHEAQLYAGFVAHASDASYIPPAKYAALHAAALDACDALDGVKDGVIEDPQKCRFDPGVLACKGADAPSCLTAAQVDTARKTYAGTRAGKSALWGLEPGSETGWASLSGPQPLGIALETYQYLVYKNPKWDFHTLEPAKDVPLADKALGPIGMNASDPDLRPFFSHGGKLLMYHGWADPGIPPMFSVEYYKNVVEKAGARKSGDEIRLFMVPGMGHCGGGDGPSTFNAMAALSQWVEQGKAPQQIQAAHVARGQTDRTHPLCPYPETAMYRGSGATSDAKNFSCK